MADKYNQRAPCTAPELLLKVVLTGTQSHYENRGVIDDKRLEHLLHAGKQILFKSHQDSDVRQNLGFSPAIWQGLTSVLSVATPVLEQLCFIYRCPDPTAYNNSSSELVAANCFTLVKEIERLNDLCTIARNLLATTKRAQNLAADRGFDQQILKLIDVCVKVTARGFDGTNARVEERHQKVCNLFKRLLITCLQFLHNFIMHNEHRKLVLWLDLFGNSQGVEAPAALPVDVNAGLSVEHSQPGSVNVPAQPFAIPQAQSSSGGNAEIPYTIEDVNALFEVMSSDQETNDKTHEAAKILMDRIKRDMERLSGMNADQLDSNPEVMLKVGAALRAQLPVSPPVQKYLGNLPKVPANARSLLQPQKPTHWSGLPDITSYGNYLADQNMTEEDLVMPRTSESAAETLQEAKDELMSRLQDGEQVSREQGDLEYEDGQLQDGEVEEENLESVDDSVDEEEEEDEEDEDYHNPNDQERGLLTDVPLVLGPTEIEALPMIIQAGIVDNFGGMKNSSDRQGAKNMQAVRCHILLAQEAGRNVLRELLIFIAAWDLPDDEFYFKMMVQIMEAILKNGLMSHAYSDFGQAKDIISPAQAVVVKILTHIFRSKYSPSPSQQSNHSQQTSKSKTPLPLSRVDILTVRYIFTVFRGNIIPETGALIYLQGQIRAGLAIADDFPLNLWDMERVYEGVYQFLEFFAVLTENNDWKRLLVDWEIVYDLVTLLKELDASIPKAPLSIATSVATVNTSSTTATEQPISLTASKSLRVPHAASASEKTQTARSQLLQAGFTLSTATAPSDGSTNPSVPRMPSPAPPVPSEDPSTFEWRNLKKLIVLVLSSLVWRSVTVQSQIRENVGVETILSCTQYDGHNPYIKEHAVMCLKFLLEGNAENQKIVRELEAQGVVKSNMEEELGLRARVEGGRVKISPVGGQRQGPPGNAFGRESGAPSVGAGERARRMARRASEGNAAAELLGERFARLDLDRQGMAGKWAQNGENGVVEKEDVFEDADDEIEFM